MSAPLIFLAIDVARLMPLAEFEERVAKLVAMVKSARPAAGFDEVMVAASALSAFAEDDPTFDSELLVVTAPMKRGVKVIDVVRALDEAGIDAVDITRREATLDEVFLALTSARPTSQEVPA